MKKNEYYDAEITDLTKEGYGVCKINGCAVFVNGTLPGDKAKIRIIKVNKSFCYGKVEELYTSNPNRVDSPCPIFKKCGGCALLNYNYNEQLKLKKKIVYDAITRIGGFKDAEVKNVIGMDNPFFYRNKAQFPVRKVNGKICIGFFSPNTHNIVPVDKCYIQNESAEIILRIIEDYIEKFNIAPYDEESYEGVLRNIFIRTGEITGEVMVCFVINTDTLPYADFIIRELTEKLPEIKSILVNINKSIGNVILGNKTVTLYGSDYIYDELCRNKFKISLKSFYQVNRKQTEILYNEAINFAQVNESSSCLDLYCGIGTITLTASKYAKEAIGVEIVPEAVADANDNAVMNKIRNVRFIEGKAEDVIESFIGNDTKFSHIFLDPPRKGCELSLLNAVLNLSPQTIVYISCDPATLSRDLKILCSSNQYKVRIIQPVDMFPHTMHVECVVLISRVD